MERTMLTARNGEAVATAEVPRLPPGAFQQRIAEALDAGDRVVAYYGQPPAAPAARALVTAILADDRNGTLALLSTDAGDALPSMAEEYPALERFERELHEQHGVEPTGHPWRRPLRVPPDLAPPTGEAGARLYAMEGESLHEVAVGPVHAGVIEPGHFRFQCHGEHVFHLEIALGYQHRGVERLLEEGPARRTAVLAESIAGDTAVGHALASARAVEGLAGIAAPPRAAAIRAAALELERVANHVGDLGALAGDVAFLPTASGCGALRADFLNALAELCGNRFGRGLVVPGGVRFDLSADAAARLADRIQAAFDRVEEVAALFFGSSSARDRCEETGVLSRDDATRHGLVGPSARASGLEVDVRRSHPFPPYDSRPMPPEKEEAGDVLARAAIRLSEARHSTAWAIGALGTLPGGPTRVALPPLAAGQTAVSLVEGWRGEIAHAVTTGPGGAIARYKVVDPSFHDWMGLALAMRGAQISDFPLCNKSFNLSYCGHDL